MPPSLATNEITFRIDFRMCQMRIIVMLQMQIAIHAIRKPHCERCKPDQPIDKRRARRMPVQQLMLKRHVPRAEHGEQRNRNAQTKATRVTRDEKPSAIDCPDQKPRRPFGAPCEAVATLRERV